MRIAFDAKRYFHNRTGLGGYSRELVDGLTNHYPDHQYYLCNPRKSQFKSGNTTTLYPPISNKLFSGYWRSYGVIQQLKKNYVQLYHGLSNEIPFRLRKAKIRSVVSIHDMIYLRYPNLYKRADRWIYERKVEYAVTHSDAVIATSQQTADDISFFYPVRSNRIVIIHQAVNMPHVSSVQDQETQNKYGLPENYFLFVGTVEERKNLFGILEAMRLSKEKKWSLAVVGKHNESYYNDCIDFIERHDLQQQVRFYQDVSREELASFYKHSIALIYPSYFEGFGIPIVEAQLCHTAVITSTGGCFAETADDAALFINPAEPAQIADAMQKLESDSLLRQQLIDLGKQNAKRFTSEKFAASVMDVYKHLI